MSIRVWLCFEDLHMFISLITSLSAVFEGIHFSISISQVQVMCCVIWSSSWRWTPSGSGFSSRRTRLWIKPWRDLNTLGPSHRVSRVQEIGHRVQPREAQKCTGEKEQKKSRSYLLLLSLLFIIRWSVCLSFQTQGKRTRNCARLYAHAPLGWTAGRSDVTTWCQHACHKH